MGKVTVKNIISRKGKGKVSVLTCYDYSFAQILDDSGVDIILVGDSMANVVLGMEETRTITVSEMLNHTRAVAKGVSRALVVADMPYLSYQKNPGRALDYAKKFIAAGADAVKIEWFSQCGQVVKKLVKNNVSVMGHIGLTPQTAHLLGGYKVQGKDLKRANELVAQAKLLDKLGVFSLVLECVPLELAKKITKAVKVPTIGIGAGKYCDGQVLVLYDLLNLYQGKRPKFVRVYCDLASQVKKAANQFIRDVKKGIYPKKEESFS